MTWNGGTGLQSDYETLIIRKHSTILVDLYVVKTDI